MVADILDRFQIVAKKTCFPTSFPADSSNSSASRAPLYTRHRLLLADEPTGNLHSTQAREIMDLFCELNSAGTTIVQVTHSEENARYGKRIIELRDGWMTRDRKSADHHIGGRRTVKNPQVNALKKNPGTPIGTRIVAGAAIILLQANMALAFQSGSTASSRRRQRPPACNNFAVSGSTGAVQRDAASLAQSLRRVSRQDCAATQPGQLHAPQLTRPRRQALSFAA